MNYKFPQLHTLSQVRAAINDAKEFIIAERDYGWVVNYMVAGLTTFPEVQTVNDAIRRECRGLIFDQDGNLISRPLSKFFNVNERDETQINRIDLSQPHVILEKLDVARFGQVFFLSSMPNFLWNEFFVSKKREGVGGL